MGWWTLRAAAGLSSEHVNHIPIVRVRVHWCQSLSFSWLLQLDTWVAPLLPCVCTVQALILHLHFTFTHNTRRVRGVEVGWGEVTTVRGVKDGRVRHSPVTTHSYTRWLLLPSPTTNKTSKYFIIFCRGRESWVKLSAIFCHRHVMCGPQLAAGGAGDANIGLALSRACWLELQTIHRFSQSRRRPLLALSHLRHYANYEIVMLTQCY